jgi:hypothetical protein
VTHVCAAPAVVLTASIPAATTVTLPGLYCSSAIDTFVSLPAASHAASSYYLPFFASLLSIRPHLPLSVCHRSPIFTFYCHSAF